MKQKLTNYYSLLVCNCQKGKKNLKNINRRNDFELEKRMIRKNLSRIFISSFLFMIFSLCMTIVLFTKPWNSPKEWIFLFINSGAFIFFILSSFFCSEFLQKSTKNMRHERLFLQSNIGITMLYILFLTLSNIYGLGHQYLFLMYIGLVLIPLITLKETILLITPPTIIIFYFMVTTHPTFHQIVELILFYVLSILISQINYMNEKLYLKKKIELEKLNEELSIKMETDPLTGLRNRYGLNRLVSSYLGESKNYHLPLSVMMIDVDFFKEYNDTFGHPAGDIVLTQISNLLKETLKDKKCVVSRFGGEEFVIFIPNMNEKEIISLSKQVLKQVKNRKIKSARTDVSKYVTVSIGIYTKVPESQDEMLDFIEHADEELYYAKSHGRNSSSMNHHIYH